MLLDEVPSDCDPRLIENLIWKGHKICGRLWLTVYVRFLCQKGWVPTDSIQGFIKFDVKKTSDSNISFAFQLLPWIF